MNKSLTALLVGAALCAFAPGASAATSFNVGTGSDPDVAVDGAGNAHIVWEANPATTINYCRVPRGATTCDLTRVLDPPGEGIGRSTYVFAPSANTVVVATHRSDELNYTFTSADNGNSFGAPAENGTLDWEGGAVYGPGASVSGVSPSGRTYQRAGAGVGSASTTFSPGFNGLYGAVALLGTAPFVVTSDGANTTFYRHSGSGEPNHAATWNPPVGITPAGSTPRLAGGSAGLAMIYTVSTPENASELHARKFDGSNFGPATVLTTLDAIEYDLVTDASGRFHALWNENGVLPNEIRYSSSADGSTWSAPETVLKGDAVDALFNSQVAAAPDGQGFAVFDQNSAGGSIVVTPLAPRDPLPGSTPSPGGGTTGGPGTGTPTPSTTPVATATVGDQELSLFGPTACVQPPEKVTLRVTSKRKKKLARSKRVKIASVVFQVDKTKKKDKKAAFKAAFSTATFPRGSFHSVRASVTLKPVKKGAFKNKRKLLKGRFNVCG